ncbi:MAG: methyltransferase domain-containing protein [Gammaproteobacteria bacterium]|nr:methyltransferase domain-containing protein [Gammaproteobacteria bacterium]
MEYTLKQRGRASMSFLVDLGVHSQRLEQQADAFAARHGLTAGLPEDPEGLQARLAPAMQESAAFRLLRMVREWQLDSHGPLAVAAFEEIRADIEPALQALQQGPTQIRYNPQMPVPAYWHGQEFHRTAGGWDGHDYMGFVHGELIHRRMVDEAREGVILKQRAAAARLVPLAAPRRILDMGCGSGQHTEGLAVAFPEAEIWGCDISARQLEEAQRRANAHGLRWQLVQAAAEDTGLPAAHFDYVTSYAMFHECPVEAQRAVLAEAHRLLEPGGYVVMTDIKAYHAQPPYERWKADFWNQVHGGDPFWRAYASTDQAALARSAGFAEARWFGVGEQQYPWVLIARKDSSAARAS